MEDIQEPEYKLPVKRIITHAFLIPWVMRKVLLRSILFPILLLVIVDIAAWALDSPDGIVIFLLGLASFIFYAFLAVTCHRIVLMGENSVPPFGIRKWEMRETRFLGWVIGIYFTAFFALVCMGVISTILLSVLGNVGLSLVQLMYLVITVLVLYMMSRLIMVFPATAIDERPSIRWSWELTNNNGWRLFLIAAVLPAVTAFFQAMLERENSTMMENIGLTALTFVMIVVEVSALSLAYKAFRENQGIN